MSRGDQPDRITVAIIYASNSGNTMRAAERISEVLRESGHAPVIRSADATAAVLEDVDFWILGSCTWLRQTDDGPKQGELPEHMYRFVREAVAGGLFRGKPCAIFGFGRHEYTKFCGAADHLEEAVTDSGGYLEVETLRVDGFYDTNKEVVDSWAHQVATTLKKTPQP